MSPERAFKGPLATTTLFEKIFGENLIPPPYLVIDFSALVAANGFAHAAIAIVRMQTALFFIVLIACVPALVHHSSLGASAGSLQAK